MRGFRGFRRFGPPDLCPRARLCSWESFVGRQTFWRFNQPLFWRFNHPLFCRLRGPPPENHIAEGWRRSSEIRSALCSPQFDRARRPGWPPAFFSVLPPMETRHLSPSPISSLPRRPPATQPEFPRISFHDGKPGSNGRVRPKLAPGGPALSSGSLTGCPLRRGFPKFKQMHPLNELIPDAHDGLDRGVYNLGFVGLRRFHGAPSGLTCWRGSPAPRNSDGNPDSLQAAVFLATIIDVTVGS